MRDSLKLMYYRWPEVLLVVLFMGGSLLLMIEHEKNVNTSQGMSLLMAGVTGIFMVLGYIFQIGFLRTVVLKPQEGFEPKELLMIGRRFLWRIVGFSIILGIVVFVLANVFFSLMVIFFADVDPGLAMAKQMEQVPGWYSLAAAMTAIVLLVRFWVFVPAIIIVNDCKLKETIRLIKRARLFRAGEIWGWLGLMVIFNGLSFTAGKYVEVNGRFDMFVEIASVIVSILLAFGLQIAAVKYVSKIKHEK